MLITLSDLCKLQSSELDGLSPSPFATLQDRLQLVLRQLHLNLPVQALLEAEPVLDHLVREVQAALPSALRSSKRLQLHYPIAAPLDNQTYVEVTVNVGFRHGTLKLFEWALRQPALHWSDRVQLWAATKHFGRYPSDVMLVVVALQPDRPAQKIVHHWTTALHEQTEQWLISLLSKNYQPTVPIPSVSVTHSPAITAVLKHLEAIEEVPL